MMRVPFIPPGGGSTLGYCPSTNVTANYDFLLRHLYRGFDANC